MTVRGVWSVWDYFALSKLKEVECVEGYWDRTTPIRNKSICLASLLPFK